MSDVGKMGLKPIDAVSFAGYKKPMQVGVYLGSFNPIHNGHILLAEQARDQFKLDAVEIVPIARPFHKNVGFMSDADRLTMTQLAVQGKQGLVASSLDMDMKTPTLEEYLVKYPQEQAKTKFILQRTLNLLDAVTAKYEKNTGRRVRLNYIVGADGLARYPHAWKDPEYAELVKKTRFLIAPRSDAPPVAQTVKALKAVLPSFKSRPLKMPFFDISSTDIRGIMQKGQAVTNAQVPQPVADYLNANRVRLLPKQTA